MLIKRLTPAHTYLHYDDPLRANTQLRARRIVDNDKTRAAMQATSDVAGDLDNAFENRPDIAVLHDFRYNSVKGDMHVDHLVITHNFHVFLIESRTTGSTLAKTDDKKFTTTDEHGTEYSIPSPIRQLRQNRAMLKRVLREVPVPTRFGRALNATVHNYVVIDPFTTVVNRSKMEFNDFVSPNQLISIIDQCAKKNTFLGFFTHMQSEQLRRTARHIAKMHAPRRVRFSHKFRHVMVQPEAGVPE
ncbi:MAG: nuclease-related domain-containing protein [Pseudomonadota bacterium]